MVRYHLFLLPAFRDPEEKVHDRLTICAHACKHAPNSLICPNAAFYVLQRDYVRLHSYRRITAYLRPARYRIRSVIQAAHKSIRYMGIQKQKLFPALMSERVSDFKIIVNRIQIHLRIQTSLHLLFYISHLTYLPFSFVLHRTSGRPFGLPDNISFFVQFKLKYKPNYSKNNTSNRDHYRHYIYYIALF